MASKENQEVLDKAKNDCDNMYQNELGNINKYSQDTNYFDTLQKAINDLELYKKVFDITLEHNRQEETICLFSGCPNCDYDFEEAICNGKCPTKEELKEFLLNEARKELENGK